MIRKNRKGKGFTIVELVIVIAVIAILAAVLIPTFASLIKKANESADIQAARQMNTALAAASVTDKPDSELELIEILAEAGFNSEKALIPVTTGCAFYWYKPENLIVLAKYEDTAAQALAMPSLVLPVSAAGSEESPVSLLYPDPEDQAEDLIDGIVTAIRANDASKIFNLEHGQDWLNAIINDEIKHVEGVELNAETEVVSRGSEFTLTATINPNDATIPEVRWYSTDPEILEVVPNENSATIKALKSGSATVVVTTVDNGHTDTCKVTVIDPVTDVDIFYGETEVTDGSVDLVKDYSKETTLSAKVSPEGADNTVTWESNNENVVTVANGVLTVVGAGEATITVTSASYPTITASCTVVVTNIEVTSIKLNETEVALNNTDKTTVQLNATVETTPWDATKPGVNWSSDRTNVATVENGVVTAVAPGTATITAECGGKSTTCQVTVTHYVTGVTLSATSITMNTGDTANLPQAIVAPNTAANQEVSWSVTEGADVVKIEGSTIKALKEGTATITVTTNDGAKTATCTVSVSDIPAEGVTISGANEIIVGNTTELTATVTPSNATNQTVIWHSDNTAVATVNEQGVVTAKSVGKVTITATVQDGSNKYDTFEIEVKPVLVSSVTLDKNVLELTAGANETLIHTINPSDATNKTVTWTSSDKSVATVENGVVTAHKGGTATITVTTEDGGFTAECVVTVTVPVESVTIKLGSTVVESIELTEDNKSETIIADIAPGNATNKDVTWSVSGDAITFDQNTGVITAVKNGTATITVTTVDGNKTATCTVHVNLEVKVTGINLNKTDITLDINGKDTLTYTINPSDATKQTVSWTSSDSTVATVENGVVTALKSGTATITATATDGSGVDAKCTVTVTDVYAVDTRDELMAVLTNGGNAKLPLSPDEPITIMIDEPIAIDDEKNVTIDLQGNTLTIDSDKIDNIVSVNNGTLTITNGDIVIACPEDEYANYMFFGIYVGENGNLVIDKANITANRVGNIVNDGTTTITDSVITVKEGYGIDSWAGIVNIDNSTLVADGGGSQIFCEGGEMNITNTKFDEGDNCTEYYNYTPIEVTGEGTKVTLDTVTVEATKGLFSISATGSGNVVEINNGTFNGVFACSSGATITLRGDNEKELSGGKTFEAIYQDGPEAAKQALCFYPEGKGWTVTCENNVITISKT